LEYVLFLLENRSYDELMGMLDSKAYNQSTAIQRNVYFDCALKVCCSRVTERQHSLAQASNEGCLLFDEWKEKWELFIFSLFEEITDFKETSEELIKQATKAMIEYHAYAEKTYRYVA